MTDLSFYFQPVVVEGSYDEVQLGAQIQVHQHAFPELKGPGCAILSVPEYRGSSHEQLPSTDFRSALYQLHAEAHWKKPIYDLGTIEPGATIEDTYYALSNVVSELVKNNIIPIVKIGRAHV